MIDRNPTDQQSSGQPAAGGGSSPPGPAPSSDLFSDLFGLGGKHKASGATTQEATAAPIAPRDPNAASAVPFGATAPTANAPKSPASLAESGLSLMAIGDLILKQLYLHGNLLGVEIARNARLPFPVIDEGLRFLKDEKCVEVASGDMIGPASYRFHLTNSADAAHRKRSNNAVTSVRRRCRSDDYIEQCRRQTVTGTTCIPKALENAFGDLILPPGHAGRTGTGRLQRQVDLRLRAPGQRQDDDRQGTGKVSELLRRRDLRSLRHYDRKQHHHRLRSDDSPDHRSGGYGGTRQLTMTKRAWTASAIRPFHEQPTRDLRWRRIKRPVVITGGELTLDMLDLRYNATSNFYTAPLHIKANGGVFLIDDFGRQIVSPRDLLNRWILPLEERIDLPDAGDGQEVRRPVRAVDHLLDEPRPARAGGRSVFAANSAQDSDWAARPRPVHRNLQAVLPTSEVSNSTRLP